MNYLCCVLDSSSNCCRCGDALCPRHARIFGIRIPGRPEGAPLRVRRMCKECVDVEKINRKVVDLTPSYYGATYEK